jgi:flagellar basal-body rod protein FlgG
MRLLGTAASGIRAQQAALDTVGNNIANVNTAGYKANRVNFSEALAAELRPEETAFNGAPVGERINVGAGVFYPAITTDFSQGTFVNTENLFDMAIDGEGFFPVRMANGQSGYTRVGNFQTDEQGRLVNDKGQMLEVRIPLEVTNLSVNEDGKITGTLNGEQKVFGQVITNTPDDEDVNYPVGDLQVDEIGRPIDLNGEILSVALVIPGSAGDVNVGPEGTISGLVNDTREAFGQLMITSFSNPEGLEKVGESLFIVPNVPGVSGDELFGAPGSQVQNRTLGKIRAQSLEQSNVDLGTSMTELIQVQRAYQVNARMITNGDQMWSLANSLRR